MTLLKSFKPVTPRFSKAFRRRLLLLGAVALLALGVANVVRYKQRTESIDHLSRKAFSEMKAYWRIREGPDPQERWWPVFWRLSQGSKDPATRQRAANISLTMLANLGRWDEITELVSDLEPQDSILVRSFAVISDAHLQSQGESAHISFLSKTIREHPNGRLGAEAALALTRYFINQRRYQAANAVVRDFDLPAQIKDPDTEEWWNAARFELENLRPGMPVPVFSLRDLEGRPVAPGDYAETPFVLLFWSPDCGPSSFLLDALRSSPPDGVQVLAVSEKPGKIEAAMRQTPGLRFATDQRLARKWNVYATPTALLFDRDGLLVGKAHNRGDLAALIQSLPG